MVVWGEGVFELRRAERWTVERRRFERRGFERRRVERLRVGWQRVKRWRRRVAEAREVEV